MSQPSRQGNSQKHKIRNEGEVTIERNQSNKTKTSKEEGEYIDFEEVD